MARLQFGQLGIGNKCISIAGVVFSIENLELRSPLIDAEPCFADAVLAENFEECDTKRIDVGCGTAVSMTGSFRRHKVEGAGHVSNTFVRNCRAGIGDVKDH